MKHVIVPVLLLLHTMCHAVSSVEWQNATQEDTLFSLAHELYKMTADIVAYQAERPTAELIRSVEKNTKIQTVFVQAHASGISAYTLLTKAYQLAQEAEGDGALSATVLMSMRKKYWQYWIDNIKPYVIYATTTTAIFFLIRSYFQRNCAAVTPPSTTVSQLTLPEYAGMPVNDFSKQPVDLEYLHTKPIIQLPVSVVLAGPSLEIVVTDIEQITPESGYVPAVQQSSDATLQAIEPQPISQQVISADTNDQLVWNKKVAWVRKRLKTIPTEKQLAKARAMMEELKKELAEQENQVTQEQTENRDYSVLSNHGLPHGAVDQQKSNSSRKQKFTRDEQQSILKVIDMTQREIAEKKRVAEEKESQQQAAIHRAIERALYEEQERIVQEERQHAAAATAVSAVSALNIDPLPANSSMSGAVAHHTTIKVDTRVQGVHYDDDLCELCYGTTIKTCLDKKMPAFHLNCCSVPGTSVKFICDACFQYWQKTFAEKVAESRNQEHKSTMADFPCPFCRKAPFHDYISLINSEIVRKTGCHE